MKGNGTAKPWLDMLDELLSDGQWHVGSDVMKEAEKLIPPGIAWRRMEKDRQRSATRRGGQADRKVNRPAETLVTMGKKAVLQSALRSRVRLGSWRVDPWPLPEGVWYHRTWQILDLRRARRAQTHLAKELSVRVDVIRALVLQDPALEHDRVGRLLYVYNDAMPELTRRVEEYQLDVSRRRGIASSMAHDRRRRAQYAEKVPLTVLAREAGIGNLAARELVTASADLLPWDRRGRTTYLPREAMDGWLEVVEEYRVAATMRRSEAGKTWRAKRREQAGSE